jgi:hypothetical protein
MAFEILDPMPKEAARFWREKIVEKAVYLEG